jgi:hypothetical protein
LNRLRELKSFLKDSEAEEYQGVDVEFIHGRKAVLTIYKDGIEQEQITLSDYATKEEMHALMVEKGFIKKKEEEIVELKRRNKELQDEEERVKQERQAENQRRLQEANNLNSARDNSAEEKALDWKKRQDAYIAEKEQEMRNLKKKEELEL